MNIVSFTQVAADSATIAPLWSALERAKRWLGGVLCLYLFILIFFFFNFFFYPPSFAAVIIFGNKVPSGFSAPEACIQTRWDLSLQGTLVRAAAKPGLTM